AAQAAAHRLCRVDCVSTGCAASHRAYCARAVAPLFESRRRARHHRVCHQHVGSGFAARHGGNGSLRRAAADRRVRDSSGLQFQSRWLDAVPCGRVNLCGASGGNSPVVVGAVVHAFRPDADEQGSSRRPSRRARRPPGHSRDVSSAHRAHLHHPRHRRPDGHGPHIRKRHRQLPRVSRNRPLGRRTRRKLISSRRTDGVEFARYNSRARRGGVSMWSGRRLLKLSCILLAMLSLAFTAGAQTLSKDSLAGMKYRLVGPFRGGRVETVVGIPGNPYVYYFGAAAGGVWKSTNAGLSWTPIFDHESNPSIGAIAIAPSDTNVIYVGTGEPCLRGDITQGNGMYKSVDAGKTWTHIGLEDTHHIAKVLIDPRNPDVVFVAAIGHAFGPNEERGVFRTTDGGKTWQKVLYKDDKTGAVDLTFAGGNFHILYAAMYEEVRKPWDIVSGGPGSGLYKSNDDGSTWHQLKGHGLPEVLLGRIGVATSVSDSERVYA